jgi:hypothetical protein
VSCGLCLSVWPLCVVVRYARSGNRSQGAVCDPVGFAWAGLVSLLEGEDDTQVPAGNGGVPPLTRGIAAPFQGVAGYHDGAGDQAVAPLVVVGDSPIALTALALHAMVRVGAGKR